MTATAEQVTIRSVEEMDELPVGSALALSNASSGRESWTKVENGMWQQGTRSPIAARNFVGAIDAGFVTLTSQPVVEPPTPNTLSVGQVYDRQGREGVRYRVVVLRTRGDAVDVARFHPTTHEWHSLGAYGVAALQEPRRFALVSDADEAWRRTASAMGRSLLLRVPAATMDAVVEQPVAPQEMVTELRAWAADNEVDSDVEDILDRHGLSNRTDHVSLVAIEGTTRYIPPAEVVQAYVGSEFTIAEVGRSTVRWTRTVEVTKRAIGCTCASVRNSDVAAFLPQNHWDFLIRSRTCHAPAAVEPDPF